MPLKGFWGVDTLGNRQFFGPNISAVKENCSSKFQPAASADTHLKIKCGRLIRFYIFGSSQMIVLDGDCQMIVPVIVANIGDGGHGLLHL